MSQQQIINLFEIVLHEDETITFSDESQADSFRMHIYRLRRKWRNHRPELFHKYEDVMIKKTKEHPNILEFTARGRQFGDILKRFNEPTIVETGYGRPMSEYERTRIENEAFGIDPTANAIRDAGFTPSQSPTAPNAPNAPTYDEVYMKASAGQTLTPDEEAILHEGPPSEPRGD